MGKRRVQAGVAVIFADNLAEFALFLDQHHDIIALSAQPDRAALPLDAHSGGTTKVTGMPPLGSVTLVTAMPRPLAASLTGMPSLGVVAVTSITGSPPAATVTTARPILASYAGSLTVNITAGCASSGPTWTVTG